MVIYSSIHSFILQFTNLIIGMITTSEVSVSLTIDSANNLEGILRSLKNFADVECDPDQSILCVVGDFMAERTGMAGTVLEALRDVP